jgi:AcrR family transcriptional regulator
MTLGHLLLTQGHLAERSSIMRRAVHPHQQAARRQQLIDSAWALFQERRYDAVNVIDVARSAGVAKGTLYNYFPSKEALFLAVLTEQFRQWFVRLQAGLAQDGPQTPEAVAALMTETLLAEPALPRLLALTHVVLEQNADRTAVGAFKEMLRKEVLATGRSLEARLPTLPTGSGPARLLEIYALLLGIQQLANPAPVVAQLLQDTLELALFQIAFAASFTTATATLLRGAERDFVERRKE